MYFWNKKWQYFYPDNMEVLAVEGIRCRLQRRRVTNCPDYGADD